MQAKQSLRWILSAALIGGSSVCRAAALDAPEDSSALPFTLSGLFDLRYAETGPNKSWLLGGPNNLRYGGNGSDGSVFAVPQASLVIEAPIPSGVTLHSQLNLNTDPGSGASIGVVEGYARYDAAFTSGDARLRAGAFIPPVSWEHTGIAWSTQYTLTPSVIGSWVGEDLRVFGAEGSWSLNGGGNSARLTGAAFTGADQAGWLLLARGWALHDYQSTLGAQLPLPNGKTDQPFQDLDGRIGYYGRLNIGLLDDAVKIGGGWWDNNADPSVSLKNPGAISNAWHTSFADAGGKLEWKDLTVLGQYLKGSSESIGFSKRYWDAWYVLCAYRPARDWQVSGRYDDFRVFGGWQAGYAWTADLQRDLNTRQRLSLEYIYMRSAPDLALRPAGETDHLVQFNWRLKFG